MTNRSLLLTATMFCAIFTACAHTTPVVKPTTPKPSITAPKPAVPSASQPATPGKLKSDALSPEAIVAALLAAKNGLPEVEVVVGGKRYACIRRPLEEYAAGVITAETVWSVYVRDLSESAGRMFDFDARR